MTTNFYLTQFTEESSLRLKNRIGKFLEKKLTWTDAYKTLLRPESFNGLDRAALAREFWQRRFHATSIEDLAATDLVLKEGAELSFEQLIDETAKQIDLRLPVLYWSRSRLGSKNHYRGIDFINGMTFAYRTNYILDYKVVQGIQTRLSLPASAKQVKAIQSLAYNEGIELKRGVLLSIEQASRILDCFDKGHMPAALMKQFFNQKDIYYSTELRYDIARG